jgi:hypothetical protein
MQKVEGLTKFAVFTDAATGTEPTCARVRSTTASFLGGQAEWPCWSERSLA